MGWRDRHCGAAIAAASYYIVDSGRTRSAQARLVTAKIVSHSRQEAVFEIANDSDRPIILSILYWSEPSLRRALLDHRGFDTHGGKVKAGETDDGKPFYWVDPIHDPIILGVAKTDLLGYRGGGGTAHLPCHVNDKRRLEGGEREVFSFPTTFHPYQSSHRYLVVFYDANGILWEREAPGSGDFAGKLRRGHEYYYHHQRRFESRLRVRLMRPLRVLAYYYSVHKWLFQNRKQSTTPYPSTRAED